MSQTCLNASSSSSSSSNFRSVFNAALDAYEKKTKNKLLTHPIANQLQSCDSPSVIISFLQGLIQEIDLHDERLTNWLNPTVKVLYAFSSTLSQGVGLEFSPANAIFSGIGVLFSTAKDVHANSDLLIDIFVRIEGFFKRLETYTEVRPTAAMTDIIVKIMIEVFSILAIVTKQIKQGRSKKILKKLLGQNDTKDALKKLDTLTMEEARMAIAETLKVTNRVDDKVDKVDDTVNRVDNKADEVDNKVGKVDYKVDKVDEVDEVDNKIDKVDNKVNKVDNTVNRVDDTVNRVDDTVNNDASLNLRMTASERVELQKWLSPPDPSTNHNIARKAHLKGTASWFFRGRNFKEWELSPSLLWVHGKPGSGKSILCSGIIEVIKAQHKAGSATMAYFYCDFRDGDKQNCRSLVLSFISQLCAQSSLCCDTLSRVYLAHNNGAKKPSNDTLEKCLVEMVSLPSQGPIYLIVDALDECPNNSGLPTPREEVLDLIDNLVCLCLPNLHICVTSRPEIDIQATLEHLTTLRVSLHNESGQKKDILDYVTFVVATDKNMRRWREEDRNLVIKTLSERADGMFRWAYCQLEALRSCLPPSVARFLQELPETLDETYERILWDIRKANREHARRLLQCLTVALRPLHVEDLAEVLAIDFDAPAHGKIPQLNPDWRWANHYHAVLSACLNLITIVYDGDSEVVQFSHSSVKEYLTSDRLARSSWDVSRYHIDLEPSHTILAQACLGVLLHLDDGVNEDNVGDIPLVKYAAQYWVNHAQFEKVASRIRDVMEYFFDADKPHWAVWCRVQMIDKQWLGFRRKRPQDAFPLYYASLGGFYDVAEHLVCKHPEHINARGGRMGTPLVAALDGKHSKVAELLHRNGADVDVCVSEHVADTPLHVAAESGHYDIASWLLDHHANVNALADNLRTPLHLAAEQGNLTVAQLLLEHGAEVDARDEMDSTPLHFASQQGYVEVMQLLLEHGADVLARDSGDQTALHLASEHGDPEDLRFLISHGADPDAQNKDEETPLFLASRKGSLEAVLLLSKHVTDMNHQDSLGRTPLHVAAENGYNDIGRSLLDRGADVNAPEKNFCTPLHLAAEQGMLAVAHLLLNHGADVDAPEKNLRTPLHLAAEQGKLEVAHLLLEHDAEVDARDEMERTPLHFASQQGYLGLVRLLLEHHADVLASNHEGRTFLDVAWARGHKEIVDVNMRYEDRQTALHIASQHGDPELLRWLIDHNVDPNAEDEDQETPLFPASRNGRVEATQLLLDADADANHRDWQGMTPLHGASENGHDAVTRLLLKHNAEVNAEHVYHWTPLHLASRAGKGSVAEVLLDGGAEVDAKNDSSWTPLHMASQKGHLDIVKLLLARHADVDARKADEETPLHLAAFYGNHAVAQVLLNNGADPRLENKKGETPFDLASREHHDDIVQLLKDMALVEN